MLTIFSIPKAFDGHIGTIQRNALRSWCALPGVEVVLVGDENGVREEAADVGALHVDRVAVNESGTPRLDDAFARVEGIARRPLRCFVNADIVLLDDFLPAVRAAHAVGAPFLVVGATTDVAVTERLDLAATKVRAALAARAREEGRSRGATAIDYFVFTPRLFDPIPPFVVGRARFDNWLVWRARSRGIVIDASDAVTAVHQRHDYSHLAGGHDEAHLGGEAARNQELAGGKSRIFTIHDASHRLTPQLQMRRNLGSLLRVRENARKVAWKLRHRR